MDIKCWVMDNLKLKSLAIAGIVLMAVSASLLAKPVGPWQNGGKAALQAPMDTMKHKAPKQKVRNRDLPYNSDAELYNAGSPANVMHERSGTLNPGRDFHTPSSTNPKKDTVSIQGRGPE
jgi:hypothetical protein